MENKQILDKDGNPITKERIKEVFKELYKDEEPWIQRQEWVEDGQVCHSWKIKTGRGYVYTNDAGAEQINQAIKKLCEDEANTLRENNKNTEEKSD